MGCVVDNRWPGGLADDLAAMLFKDLAVAELVRNLGAEGAWAKIIEGVLGEPAAERAAQVSGGWQEQR